MRIYDSIEGGRYEKRKKKTNEKWKTVEIAKYTFLMEVCKFRVYSSREPKTKISRF